MTVLVKQFGGGSKIRAPAAAAALEDITTGGPAVPISTLATSTNTVAAAAGSVAADSDNDSVHGDTASVRSAKRRKKKKAKSKVTFGLFLASAAY